MDFDDAVLPNACSDEEPEECDLEAIIEATNCFDNGTSTDGSDDTYSYTIRANGATGDYTIRYFVPADRPDDRGTFGVSETFPGFDTDINVSAELIPDDQNCDQRIAISVQSTGECVDCQLSVVELSNVCDGNGTADPSDDTYTVTVEINHAGDGNGYMVEVPGIGTVIGLYNSADTIRSFTFDVADGDVTLNFMDLQFQEACADDITFTAPVGGCSPCDLSVSDPVYGECLLGDDVSDPNDDEFVVTITVTSESATPISTWRAFRGTTVVGEGNYGEPTDLFLATGTGNFNLFIADMQDGECTGQVFVEVPETCTVTPPCDITTVRTSAPVCTADGNGYTFTVIVENTGTATADGWVASNGQTGNYNEEVTVTVDDVCNGATIVFRDANLEDCFDDVTVNAPVAIITAPEDTELADDQPLICEDYTGIFNQEGSLALTGNATVEGCGVQSVTFVDTYLTGGPDATDNCTATVIERVFTVTTCSGQTVSDTQRITIRKPLVSDVIFPTTTVDFDCEGDGFATDANGNPATSETGIPAIVTAFGDTVRFGDTFCETLSVSYADEEEETCSGTTTIRRTWTATDACTGNSLSSVQIIRTGDFSAPIVSCPTSNHYCPIIDEDIMLFPMDPFACTVNLTVPQPEVTDACSDSWTVVTYVVSNTGLGDTVAIITDGQADRNVALEAGDYVFRYAVTDDCGNIAVQDCIFRVADTQEPAAICISDINVSVGGYGIARIYSRMIDLGSYDNCGLDSILVRRQILVDEVTGDTLDIPTWSAWDVYTDVFCEDAGTEVVLQLRVVDFAGNANVCTTTATVVDNTLPYCTGLEDLFLTCADVPVGFDANDTLSLQAAFGVPTVIDNCAADAIELTPIVNLDECMGDGTIVRRWVAVDAIGNVSAQEFRQTITIVSDMNFTLVLPKDTLTDCLDPDQGFAVIGESCADITVSFQDTIVPTLPSDGDACLVIERKYTIINNCIFDPLTDELVVITRDEDCDGEEGESVFYAQVFGDSTFIDVDTSFTNAIPAAGVRGDECDGATNPTGYLRRVRNTGGWTYTQRISIFDDTNPVLDYVVPEVFCATEEENCETIVEIPITVENECTAAGADWLVLIDLGRDGNPEMRLPSELAVQGTFPNYFIKASIPLGAHNLMLRYVDGCNNSVTAAIPFEIVDCSIPDPICYSGLIADLETLDAPVVGTDGELITVGARIDAGRLASCDIEDCSGPLRYSVNRIGETPNVDSTDIVLTCDDRYRVELEVYQWDNANNPFSVQPDGTIGGPNWTKCVVEVLVQDPDQLCNDCNADGSLNLGGSFTTQHGVVLPGVEVELTGTMEGFGLSSDNGKYVFSGIVAGNYVVTPTKADDAGNGVSTLDELILQYHLVGQTLITDPLMFMAADINGDGELTIVDRLLIRNINLGNTDVLPNGETWRFVPVAAVEGAAIENGRVSEMPRSIEVLDLDACAFGHDFYAIKLGDLNNSVYVAAATGEVLNGTPGRSSNETQLLEIEERRFLGGELFELPVRAKDLELIAGVQLSLNVEPTLLTIEDVVPGLLNESRLNRNLTARGLVTASWTQEGSAIGGDAILFTLRLRANAAGRLSEAISTENAPTRTEAYRVADLDLMNVALNFPESDAPADPPIVGTPELDVFGAMELEQNFPNPFVAETSISFKLPHAGKARLNVYDLTGRVLQEVEGDFPAGVSTVKVDGRKLPAAMLVYTITFEGQRLTRTMIRN